MRRSETGDLGGSLTLDVVTSLAEAQAVLPAWARLMDDVEDHSPFIEPDWLVNWWLAFARPDDEMRLTVVRQGSKLLAVAPFLVRIERRRVGVRRVLRFWSNVYSNRCNLIVGSSHARFSIRYLVQEIFCRPSGWDVAVLGDIARTDRTTNLFLAELEAGDVPYTVRRMGSSPFLRLPKEWKHLEDSLSGSFRTSLRRKRRAAARRNLRTEIVSTGQALREVFSVDIDSWQFEAGSGLTSTVPVRRFYEQVAGSAADRGTLEVALLKDGSCSLAFEFNLRQRGIVYNLKQGYRRRASDLSPGIVLREQVLRYGIASGADEFDFLGAAERHKLHWTEATRPLASIVVPGASFLARANHFAEHRIRSMAKQYVPGLAKVGRLLRKSLTPFGRE